MASTCRTAKPARMATTARGAGAAGAQPAHPGDKPLASPAVRRRAWDLGVDLQYVPGSGPAGRISHQDLDAYVARGARGAAAVGPTCATRNAAMKRRCPSSACAARSRTRCREAKRRIPHFTYVEEVDMTELEALRQRQLNAVHGKARGKLTVIPSWRGPWCWRCATSRT